MPRNPAFGAALVQDVTNRS